MKMKMNTTNISGWKKKKKGYYLSSRSVLTKITPRRDDSDRTSCYHVTFQNKVGLCCSWSDTAASGPHRDKLKQNDWHFIWTISLLTRGWHQVNDLICGTDRWDQWKIEEGERRWLLSLRLNIRLTCLIKPHVWGKISRRMEIIIHINYNIAAGSDGWWAKINVSLSILRINNPKWWQLCVVSSNIPAYTSLMRTLFI